MQKIVIVNFKAYKKAVGKKALDLAKVLAKNSKGIDLMVAVQNVDLYHIASKVKVKVLAEHVDYVSFGPFTGKVLVEAVKQEKAYGALLNHAEDKLKFGLIKKTVRRCKEVKLKTIVCCASLREAKKIVKLKPDYIAFEVPELIGTGKSISKEKPESVKKFVEIVGKKSIPLCGAGISTNKDFKAALQFGCKGVLLASGITKAKDSGKALRTLIKK